MGKVPMEFHFSLYDLVSTYGGSLIQSLEDFHEYDLIVPFHI